MGKFQETEALNWLEPHVVASGFRSCPKGTRSDWLEAGSPLCFCLGALVLVWEACVVWMLCLIAAYSWVLEGGPFGAYVAQKGTPIWGKQVIGMWWTLIYLKFNSFTSERNCNIFSGWRIKKKKNDQNVKVESGKPVKVSRMSLPGWLLALQVVREPGTVLSGSLHVCWVSTVSVSAAMVVGLGLGELWAWSLGLWSELMNWG